MHVRCDNCGSSCQIREEGQTGAVLQGTCHSCGHAVRIRARRRPAATPAFGVAPPQARYLFEREEVTSVSESPFDDEVELAEDDLLFGVERTRTEWGPAQRPGKVAREAEDAVPEEVSAKERTQREAIAVPVPEPAPVPDEPPPEMLPLPPALPQPPVVLPAPPPPVPTPEVRDSGTLPPATMVPTMSVRVVRPRSPARTAAGLSAVVLSLTVLLVASRHRPVVVAVAPAPARNEDPPAPPPALPPAPPPAPVSPPVTETRPVPAAAPDTVYPPLRGPDVPSPGRTAAYPTLRGPDEFGTVAQPAADAEQLLKQADGCTLHGQVAQALEGYRRYLAQYPRGPGAGHSRRQIIRLKRKPAPPKPKAQPSAEPEAPSEPGEASPETE